MRKAEDIIMNVMNMNIEINEKDKAGVTKIVIVKKVIEIEIVVEIVVIIADTEEM